MSCERHGAVTICRPTSIVFRKVRHCPICNRRRRFVESVAIWYGATWTCLGCGDSWADGYRMHRPFARGWRDKERRKARQMWDEAPPAHEARQMLDDELAEYVP